MRISSIILIKTFSTIWLDFWKRVFVSFALEFHELNMFKIHSQGILGKVDFNIMLISAINGNAFKAYKESCFYKMTKSWKEESTLTLPKVIVTKMCLTKLSSEICHKLLQTMLNFILNVFHLQFYYINQVHGFHDVPSNTFHQSVIILTFPICSWNLRIWAWFAFYDYI